jgi:hypothetical protein
MRNAKLYALCAPVSLLLIACGAPKNQVSNTASNSIDQVRKLFNQNACEGIYAQSTAFFRTQPLADWVGRCDKLRQQLGDWQTFESESADACSSKPKSICFVDGRALFAKQKVEMTIGWRVEAGQLRLLFWALKQSGKNMERFPPRLLQHFDAPNSPKLRPALSLMA